MFSFLPLSFSFLNNNKSVDHSPAMGLYEWTHSIDQKYPGWGTKDSFTEGKRHSLIIEKRYIRIYTDNAEKASCRIKKVINEDGNLVILTTNESMPRIECFNGYLRNIYFPEAATNYFQKNFSAKDQN